LLRQSVIGQPHQHVTIEILPDDILLKIFKSFVDELFSYYDTSEEWRTLVHTCRRWRYLAFTCPRHLNLQLLCRPPSKSVKMMLDIWPELPIYVHDFNCQTKEVRDDVAAGLRLKHRVSGIRIFKASDSAWESFLSLMQHSFPLLTQLWVQPCIPIKDVIPRSFLGGSAPSLRDLLLVGVPFPAFPELLLSSTNLVRLLYSDIPLSGFISPQKMVTGLSALTRLESFHLSFRSPRDLPDREIRIPPPPTRTLLPALTSLHFRGAPEYLEDLVAQFNAPLLKGMTVSFFHLHREFLEVSELAKFARRADKLSLLDRAVVTVMPSRISVLLSRESLVGRVDPKTLMIIPKCRERDFRLSYLVQLCSSCLPTLAPFECLHIPAPIHFTWQEDVIDDPDPRWLELLRIFNTVKNLRLYKPMAFRIARALKGLPVEQVTEVLPALETVFISGLEPWGPVLEAISEFADARQLSGRPLSIHWEGEVHVEEQGNGSRGQ
jgi:hypothetical protein